jgi:predicted ArsR family transcriptional regulator
MRPQGSPAELERRRVRAIELLQRDVPVHVVAERLGVDRRSVRAHLICLDETGFLMLPVLRRTWAPCGATLTFAVRARSHEKVSGIGALVVSPRRRQITSFRSRKEA